MRWIIPWSMLGVLVSRRCAVHASNVDKLFEQYAHLMEQDLRRIEQDLGKEFEEAVEDAVLGRPTSARKADGDSWRRGEARSEVRRPGEGMEGSGTGAGSGKSGRPPPRWHLEEDDKEVEQGRGGLAGSRKGKKSLKFVRGGGYMEEDDEELDDRSEVDDEGGVKVMKRRTLREEGAAEATATRPSRKRVWEEDWTAPWETDAAPPEPSTDVPGSGKRSRRAGLAREADSDDRLSVAEELAVAKKKEAVEEKGAGVVAVSGSKRRKGKKKGGAEAGVERKKAMATIKRAVRKAASAAAASSGRRVVKSRKRKVMGQLLPSSASLRWTSIATGRSAGSRAGRGATRLGT